MAVDDTQPLISGYGVDRIGPNGKPGDSPPAGDLRKLGGDLTLGAA